MRAREHDGSSDATQAEVDGLLEAYVSESQWPGDWDDVLRRRERGVRSRPRVRVVVGVAASMLILGVGGLVVAALRDAGSSAAESGDSTSVRTRSVPESTWTDTVNRISITVPDGWHRATTTLTPGLVNPREVLSMGTSHLVPSDMSANMPSVAAQAVGPRDALISLQERRDASPNDFPGRPSVFRLQEVSRTQIWGSSLSYGARSWWIPFRDRDRAFYLLVVAGREIPVDGLNEILNSLRIDP